VPWRVRECACARVRKVLLAGDGHFLDDRGC
jgi:hypothetical protein